MANLAMEQVCAVGRDHASSEFEQTLFQRLFLLSTSVSKPRPCSLVNPPQHSLLAMNQPPVFLPFHCEEQDAHGSWLVELVHAGTCYILLSKRTTDDKWMTASDSLTDTHLLQLEEGSGLIDVAANFASRRRGASQKFPFFHFRPGHSFLSNICA